MKGCLGNGIDALALENVIGIFYLFAGAFGVALMIFIVECMVKYVNIHTLKYSAEISNTYPRIRYRIRRPIDKFTKNYHGMPRTQDRFSIK